MAADFDHYPNAQMVIWIADQKYIIQVPNNPKNVCYPDQYLNSRNFVSTNLMVVWITVHSTIKPTKLSIIWIPDSSSIWIPTAFALVAIQKQEQIYD